MTWSPQFGGKVRKTDLEKFSQSPYWNGEKFVNLIPTEMHITLKTLPKLLKDNFSDRWKRSPSEPLKIEPYHASDFESGDEPRFIWYGHSVALFRMKDSNFLIDPMFGPDAAPIAPFSSARFSENTLEIIDDLPSLDAVFLTHDHYDHLDYDSIQRLIPKVKRWVVALGVSRHLERWGVNREHIEEMDWWDETTLGDIGVIFTPSRHFSGRGAFDRAKSLWGGWVFRTGKFSVYWSGDGGYGPHFKEIGQRFGPFDWGFMECGQYNENWHAIHMYPEESIQAALDAGVKVATPVHWGGFSLALHSWKDPVKRFYNSAKSMNLDIVTPRLGEMVKMTDKPKQLSWWLSLK